MPIFYNEKNKSFTLNTLTSTYAMYVTEYNLLTHL